MEKDSWDFYFCAIDGARASIFFNETVMNRAPLPKHEALVVLSVRARAPRDNGFPSDEDLDALLRIEEVMEEVLAPPRAFYAGRATHAGLRDFYFYTTDAAQVESSIDEAMRKFPDYEYATPTENDADWRIYRDFLYPSLRDRQCIENRKVCEGLEKHGDPLTAKREIAHWAYFPDARTLDEFVQSTAKLGFELRDKFEPDGDQSRFGACIVRNDFASWNEINEVTLELYELASALGGEYDGWETSVEKG